jgi:hypothetical protein
VSFDKLASVHKQSGDVNFLACASARNRWRGARRGFGHVFAIGLGLSVATSTKVCTCAARSAQRVSEASRVHLVFGRSGEGFRRGVRVDLARLDLRLFDCLLDTKSDRILEGRRTEIRFRHGAKVARLSRTALPETG